jgi:hypothetical protein
MRPSSAHALNEQTPCRRSAPRSRGAALGEPRPDAGPPSVRGPPPTGGVPRLARLLQPPRSRLSQASSPRARPRQADSSQPSSPRSAGVPVLLACADRADVLRQPRGHLKLPVPSIAVTEFPQVRRRSRRTRSRAGLRSPGLTRSVAARQLRDTECAVRAVFGGLERTSVPTSRRSETRCLSRFSCVRWKATPGVEPGNNGFADRRVSHFATSPQTPRGPRWAPGDQADEGTRTLDLLHGKQTL